MSPPAIFTARVFSPNRGSRGGAIIGWLQGRPCTEDGEHVLWISPQQGIEVTCDLKYINHSERPNACYYDDLSVVALRDIAADEEITHDYACNVW